MAKTAQFGLPLVAPSQAQKHVTVNEALARLDAVAQPRVVSSSVQEPPAVSSDGTSYLVPQGSIGAWVGRAGHVAVWSNGGWVFLVPKAGWRVWDDSQGRHRQFDGTDWITDALVVSPGGAATCWRVVEFDHVIAPGAANLTATVVPVQAQVLGVTGRVVSSLTGPGLTGWRIGVSGADDRYGTDIGLAANSVLVGLSGSPVTYYSATPLLISAETGTLGGGIIRIAIHFLELTPPRTV